jgi:DNA-binding beta-propeller fold protein YncE
MTVRRYTLTFLAWLCMSAGGLLLWSAPALAARNHVFDKAFGGEGSGNGQLSNPQGVAVNEATGDVYVVDEGNDRVEYFTSTGTYIGQFNGSGTLSGEGSAAPTGKFSSPESVAVDNSCQLHKPEPLTDLTTPTCDEFDPSDGDVYVADRGHAVIDKFSSTGAYIGQLTDTTSGTPFVELEGVAVDPSGELWVYQGNVLTDGKTIDAFTNALANVFSSSSEPGLNGGANPGFAVDSEDNLYAKAFFAGISKVNSSGEILVEEFDSLLTESGGEEVPSGVAIELSSNDVYIDDADEKNSVVRFSSTGSVIESFGSEHLIKGRGIAIDSQTGGLYVADSAANTVDIFTLESPGPPTVESESASDVTAGSTTFNAGINPHGASTEYHFEYGPTTSYGTSIPIPDASVGSGYDAHEVSVHSQDLSPRTTYHFRVVAHNEFETVDGTDQTFTTQTIGGELALPDDRQWQMVSPPNKFGALFDGIGFEAAAQASANGNAMTYFANLGSTESEPQGVSFGGQVLSTRESAGWSSKDIATPHDEPTGFHPNGEYLFFSEDFSRALVQPPGSFSPLTACSPMRCESEAFPEATRQTPYLRHNATCTSEIATCYEPLLTGVAVAADVPPGTEFGSDRDEFTGASPDLNHVVLTSEVALTPTLTKQRELYEWSANEPATERLQLISILPESEGGEPVSSENVYLGSDRQPLATGWRPVSNEGSRVFWTNGNTFKDPRRLYMRDTAKGETIRLDVQQPGAPSGGTPEPLFEAASSNGSKVFFTDRNQQLVTQSGEHGFDLYECEIVEEAGKDACKLADLTPESNGESAEVQNLLPGTSEDGSYVYFVANGVLAPGATPGACKEYSHQKANATTCNLYVHHDGRTTFIATLSLDDEYDWGGVSEGFRTVGRLTARVSPDGRYLTFMSNRALTGYENRDAVTGKPDEEVYLYNAESNKLVCASCNPTGSRPVGVQEIEFGGSGDGTHTANLVDVLGESGVEAFGGGEDAGIAANLPTGKPIEAYNRSLYQPRYLSNSGRLFFNSDNALVPQDVNGQEDVYEYEPPEVGSCTASSSTYSERSGGCVDLISSGTSYQESGFMDASETGGDVFFLTSAKLAPQDYDTALDVYDAHECTGQSPCLPAPSVLPPACTNGDACKAAPTPQPAVFGSPASATFSGAGNIMPAVSKPVMKAKKPKVKRKPKKRKGRGKAKKSGKKNKKGRRAKRSKAKKSLSSTETRR